MVKIIFNCETKEEMVKQRELVHHGLVGSQSYVDSEIVVYDIDETTFGMIVGDLNKNNIQIWGKNMNDKVLVVKINHVVSSERLDLIRQAIVNQMKTGVVLLPFGCEAIVVPEDIEVKVEGVKNE